MAEFVEVNYQGNLPGTDFMWGVHASGCRDIVKDIRSYRVLTSHFSASTLREVLDQVVDGECRDLGWGDEHVKVHNCVKTSLRAEKVLAYANHCTTCQRCAGALRRENMCAEGRRLS